MNKDKQYQNIKCMNTMIVAYNPKTKRNEAVTTEVDGKSVRQFTTNLLVTYVGTTDSFACDSVLQSSRLLRWQEAKPQIQLVPGVDYVLVEDSDTDWDATDTKPRAVSATYRPAAVFVE